MTMTSHARPGNGFQAFYLCDPTILFPTCTVTEIPGPSSVLLYFSISAAKAPRQVTSWKCAIGSTSLPFFPHAHATSLCPLPCNRTPLIFKHLSCGLCTALPISCIHSLVHGMFPFCMLPFPSASSFAIIFLLFSLLFFSTHPSWLNLDWS